MANTETIVSRIYKELREKKMRIYIADKKQQQQ
jgi:hypothetical protein